VKLNQNVCADELRNCYWVEKFQLKSFAIAKDERPATAEFSELIMAATALHAQAFRYGV
jgi:hypothetical protein